MFRKLHLNAISGSLRLIPLSGGPPSGMRLKRMGNDTDSWHEEGRTMIRPGEWEEDGEEWKRSNTRTPLASAHRCAPFGTALDGVVKIGPST